MKGGREGERGDKGGGEEKAGRRTAVEEAVEKAFFHVLKA